MKFFFTLILFFTCFLSEAQYDGSIYEKYNKALESGNHKKAKKELAKLSKLENNELLVILNKAIYFGEIKEYDSSLYYLNYSIGYGNERAISYESQNFQVVIDSMYGRSIELLDKIILTDSTAHPIFTRGLFKARLKQYELALKDVQICFQMDATDAYAASTIALYNRKLNNLDSALYYYDVALELDPKMSTSHLNKGFLFIEKEMYFEAIASFKQSLAFMESVKSLSFTFNNMAYCYTKMQMYPQARTILEESLALNSLNSYAYRNLALLEIAEGNPKEACQAINKAIELGFVHQYGDEIMTMKKEHCSN